MISRVMIKNARKVDQGWKIEIVILRTHLSSQKGKISNGSSMIQKVQSKTSNLMPI
jgi:hypothetical protein